MPKLNPLTTPIATLACVFVGPTGTTYPLARHEGVHYLPWVALVELLGLGASSAKGLRDLPGEGLGVIDLALPLNPAREASSFGGCNAFVSVDRFHTLVATLVILAGGSLGLVILQLTLKSLMAAHPDIVSGEYVDPTINQASAPTDEKAEAPAPSDTVPLEVRIYVEGGTPELNRGLGNVLLNALDRVPGTRIETPSPTKH
jgi:hypothetical protein